MAAALNFSIIAALIFGLAACVSRERFDGGITDADFSMIFFAPERYDEVAVRVRACVNVTFHDVTLLSCGTEGPQVNVESGGEAGAGKAYSRLIKFAHAHMGQEPQDLPVVIEGVYRNEVLRGGSRHVIYVYGFHPDGR